MKLLQNVILFSFVVSLQSCLRSDEYFVHGNLRCVRATTAYMIEMTPDGTAMIVDSTPIRTGEFRFHGHVDYPTMRFIRIGTRAPFDLFLENSNIRITGSLLVPEEIKIEGSSSHDDFNFLSSKYKRMIDDRNSVKIHIANARKQKKAKEVQRLQTLYKSYPDSILWMTKQYVRANPKSVAAAYFVCSLSQSVDIEKLEEIINLFDIEIEYSPYVQYLNQELLLKKKLAIGMSAPDFCIRTFLGDSVGLSNYSGKYLFVDFGASWIESTRERIGKLKNIREAYDGDGFDVLSVFLDDDKKIWHNYLETVGLVPWRLACDFKYWNSPMTKYYRVTSIPYGVLISPDGRIALVDPSFGVLNTYLKKKLKEK